MVMYTALARTQGQIRPASSGCMQGYSNFFTCAAECIYVTTRQPWSPHHDLMPCHHLMDSVWWQHCMLTPVCIADIQYRTHIMCVVEATSPPPPLSASNGPAGCWMALLTKYCTPCWQCSSSSRTVRLLTFPAQASLKKQTNKQREQKSPPSLLMIASYTVLLLQRPFLIKKKKSGPELQWTFVSVAVDMASWWDHSL